MRQLATYLYYNLKNRALSEGMRKKAEAGILKNYAGTNFYSVSELNNKIIEMINSKEPFLIARFGTTELACIRAFDFHMEKVYKGNLFCMEQNSGFFPKTNEMGFRFVDVMKSSICQVDVLGSQFLRLEDYYIKKFMSNKTITAEQKNLEPFKYPTNPWSKALAGKKVLVIHPFVETIKRQYKKRELIFPGTDILPEFHLRTLKAVQTIAGTKDEKFADWFEALEYMYNEALKIDFDIALLGCGAYGFPLAAKLKQEGKQAIHLGGVTQGLFGIRCKRFDEAQDYGHIRKFYNEHWCYPSGDETPKGFKNVENGCYWRQEA